MIKTRKSTIALVSVLTLCMIVSVTALPATSFLISGHVFNADSSECDNPSVSVTNMNTSQKWRVGTDANSNYYQLTLANGTNVNESEILQFNVKSSDGEETKTLTHTVTQEDIDSGGLSNFNITLESEGGYDVNLTSNHDALSTQENENATYTLTVGNTGSYSDNYTLTRVNPDGADIAELNRTTITNLAPSGIATVTLNVTNATAGTFRVNVTVTSDDDPTNNATDFVNTTTTVGKQQQIIWQGDVTLTNGTTFNVTAHNSGDSYVINGTTALGALDTAAETGDFNYTVNDEWYASWGTLFVDSIADVPNEGVAGWMYWVNYPEDPMPMVGADNYTLEDGDVVTWFWSSSMNTTPDNSSTLVIINATVGPITGYGVNLTVDKETKTTVANLNATYILTVNNTGNNTDNYMLRVDNPDRATVADLSTDTIRNLAPSKTAIVLLNVTNVTAATAKEFRMNVTVSSAGDASKIAYVNITTSVGATKTFPVPAGTGEINALGIADTECSYNTAGEVNITIGNFTDNPETSFSGEIGKYTDVRVDNSTNVNNMTIKQFYKDSELGDKNESLLRMYWWNGTAWDECSNTGVNTTNQSDYNGYIWVFIDGTTTPSLADLTGTPFAAATEVTAPTITINLPTSGWYKENILVNATVTDDTGVDVVQFRWENATTNGSWMDMNKITGTDDYKATLYVTTVADGNYTIRVNATDYATNEATETVSDIGVDTTKHKPTPRRGGAGGGGGQRADTDLDGYTDFNELKIGSDPNDPCDPNPKSAACLALEAEVIVGQEPTAAPTTAPTAAPTPTPTKAASTPTPTPKVPGFEAVFAIAGLLAVAYLVLIRKRE